MGNKNNKQKILNNEVNEEKLDKEKLDKVSGGDKIKFTPKNIEQATGRTIIEKFGIPK